MKRLLAIFAALSLLFTLTACGAEDSSAASASAAGSFSAFSSADAGNSPFVFTRGNFPAWMGPPPPSRWGRPSPPYCWGKVGRTYRT